MQSGAKTKMLIQNLSQLLTAVAATVSVSMGEAAVASSSLAASLPADSSGDFSTAFPEVAMAASFPSTGCGLMLGLLLGWLVLIEARIAASSVCGRLNAAAGSPGSGEPSTDKFEEFLVVVVVVRAL
jgi:hypothetical protein